MSMYTHTHTECGSTFWVISHLFHFFSVIYFFFILHIISINPDIIFFTLYQFIIKKKKYSRYSER